MSHAGLCGFALLWQPESTWMAAEPSGSIAMLLYWLGPCSSCAARLHEAPPSPEAKSETLRRADSLGGCVSSRVRPSAVAVMSENTIGSGRSCANQPTSKLSPPS